MFRLEQHNAHAHTERDVLMQKLVEVELDGQAAAKQTAVLRDQLRRYQEVRTFAFLTLR